MTYEELTLTRDCEVVRIPFGDTTTIPAGTGVVITQQLGDNYTIQVPELGGMYRVAGRDADALGKPKPASVAAPADADAVPVEEEKVWEQLRMVYDPEIPVNVVDLGLVYNLTLEEIDGGGTRAVVTMTLTAPACPMADMIAMDARSRVESVPGVTEGVVNIVFDPPWNHSMMTEAARLELGFM